ncbi:MAG: hypothetical protein QM741_05335 [Rudaea sp.]|uniref:hypothetical protein n=1 Tax=Rudaea sp. TaxID=2136325 RepID=UPI0039E3EB69
MRAAVWLAILALALLGRWRHDDAITAAVVPLALAFLFFASPRTLRGAVAAMALVEAAAWWFGGVAATIDLLPAAIAAFVGWLFARSLLRPRRPLIARAIAAIDGEATLRDAGVVRYARRLTLLWAVFQFALTALCVLCLLGDRGLLSLPCLPSPRLFGTTVLPLAVAALFFGEFFLRPALLPQAPRHTLAGFLAALARVWPQLIER